MSLHLVPRPSPSSSQSTPVGVRPDPSSSHSTSATVSPDPSPRQGGPVGVRPGSTSSHSAPSPRPSGRTQPVCARLNQEWDDLRREPAEWLRPPPSLDDVLTSIRFNPDRVLGDLIRACQTGHATAGRVIIQALLPKLVLMSHSYPYPTVENMAAAMWLRIARYPLDRRPESVAANLVLDSRKDVVAENRAHPAGVIAVAMEGATVAIEGVAGFDEAGLSARSVIETARDLGLATPESLEIVELVYVGGMPSRAVGEIYALSADAVRRRCSDTLRRLRAHRQILAELAAA